MNRQRCYQILDLEENATLEEVRRAYKDLVAVWHPDRFSHNPRLQQKAEARLKEINRAYESLEEALGAEKDPHRKAGEGSHSNGSRRESEGSGKTEVAFEWGTTLALTLWSRLSGNLKRLFQDFSEGEPCNRDERSKASEGEAPGPPPRPGDKG